MIWPEIPILLPQSRMERVQLLVEEKKKKAVWTPQKWLKTSAGLLFKNIAWCDSNVSRNNTATFGSDVLFMVGYRCVRRRNIKPSLLLRVVPCWSVVSGPCDVQCTIASDKVNKQILGIWKVAFSFHAQSRS